MLPVIVAVLILRLVPTSTAWAQDIEFLPGTQELEPVKQNAFPGQEWIIYDGGRQAIWLYSNVFDRAFLIRYTPQAYPCEIVRAYGFLAYYRYNNTIELRVYNHEKELIHSQRLPDLPKRRPLGPTPAYTAYLNPLPVITEGDFYMGVWQQDTAEFCVGEDNDGGQHPDRMFKWTAGTWEPIGRNGDLMIRALVNYHDVGITGINTPPDSARYEYGDTITPSGLVTNFASNLQEMPGFLVDFRILNASGAVVWSDSATVVLDSGEVGKVVYFRPVSLSFPPGGTFTAVCSTRHPLDCRPTNNCLRHAFTVSAGGIANQPEEVNAYGLHLYPNPVHNGMLHLAFNPAPSTLVQVYDATGQCVLRRAFRNASDASVDLRKLSSGVYLVRLENGSSRITHKLLVQQSR